MMVSTWAKADSNSIPILLTATRAPADAVATAARAFTIPFNAVVATEFSF